MRFFHFLFLLALYFGPIVSLAAQTSSSIAGTYVLTNIRLETISGGTIEQGTLVIREGQIDTIGTDVPLPDDADVVIDGAGLTVYPGMIDGGTFIGLMEIGSIAETQDQNEIGEVTPHMLALTAVNPNSELIKTTRQSGVTTALTMPSGGLMPGTAALVNLHGYTPAQMDAGFRGVLLNFPTHARRHRFDRRSEADIKKEARKAMKVLDELWSKAVQFARIDSAYTANPDPDRMPEFLPDMQALATVVRGEVPLLIEVNAAKDIAAALDWVKEKNIRVIFTGVAEGWRLADRIAEAGIPCIVGPVLSLPTRNSDRYDKPYANAGLLHQAGVKITLRTRESENVRNLPFHAGFAATYGLGREAALRAITLNAAEIFGVDADLGSLEAGKKATLFIADGDPFEPKTTIEHVFIDGYLMPKTDRQKALYDEFLNRQPGIEKAGGE